MKYIVSFFLLLIFFAPQKSGAEPWEKMNLVGSGKYKYLGFVTLYRARLFTEGNVQNVLEPAANKCLVLDYEVEITAEQFAEAANTILQRQLTSKELEHIHSEINQFNSSYRSIEDGDRYSLCFDGASQTTTLALNGDIIISIRSSEFAAAYFGIWLGDHEPINQLLRRDLLGIAQGMITSL